MQQGAFTFRPLDRAPVVSRRNLVIEAGAGTGKTTAIVAEVLQLLLENETLSPERIILVTFTEKAAAEIASRIHAGLADMERQLDDPQTTVRWPQKSDQPLLKVPEARREAYRQACKRQLERADSLRSQTIHSFCQSILRAYPIEAGLDPQFRIIEGFERTLLYGQLYDSWLDADTRTNPAPEVVQEWEFLLAKVGYLFEVRNLIFSLLDRRDLLNETKYSLGDLDEVEPALITAIRRIRSARLDDVDPSYGLRVFSYIQRTPPPEPGSIDNWIDYFTPIAAAIREANLPKLKSQLDLKEALITLRASDQKGACIYDRLVGHRGALALLAMTRRFAAFLEKEKQKAGVLDFDDLLLHTQNLLEHNKAVLERVRQQYDYIFVDEFQDTDRTQARIIEMLGRDRSGAWVPGRTVVVGDPKQSIYGFRRADPQTYYQTTQSIIDGGGERRLLEANYRSDPPLLETFNVVFGRLFPPVFHDPNVFRPTYHALRPAKPAAAPADAHITLLRAESEPEAIASWIQSHAGTDGDLRRYAVLFRRLTRLDEYLDVFDRLDLRYVLPPTRMFLDRPAAVDLVTVLRTIAYPFDRGAWVSAARTPYFGLTDEEIAEGLLIGDGRAWQEYAGTVEQYREIARTATLTALIDAVIESTGIERVYEAAADGTRSQRHLDHLRALAFQYEQDIGGSVRQFVDEIARRRGEPEEMEPSLLDESRNAIRILTVHAAKGLEFDNVILPDLDFKSTGSDGVQLFTVEEPPSLVMTGRTDSISANFRCYGPDKLKKLISQREEAEARRLFYVAMTRARNHVVFAYDPDGRKQAFRALLFEAFGLTPESIASLWPEEGRTVREITVGTSSIPIAFQTSSCLGTGPKQLLERIRLRDRVLEAELRSGPIVELTLASPPAQAALTAAEAAIALASLGSRPAGTLLHRVLEVWDGAEGVETALRRAVAELGVSDDTAERVRQRLAVIARSEAWQRIMRAETVARELPLRFLDGERVVEKRVDRVIRENGSLLVIDYKSGSSDQHRLEADKAQVRRYCRALAELSGSPCRGALWYIGMETDEWRPVDVDS